MQIVLHRLILKTYRLSCLITLLLILVPLRAKPKSESDLKILQSDPQSIIFQIDVPLVSYRNNTISGKPYLIPSVPGYVLSGEPGAPALPQKAFNFGAPPNASVGLEILEAVEKVESRRSGVQIAPAPSLKSLDSENRNQFKPEYNEDSIYHSRAWVPYQIARLHELGNVRDQRIVSVVVSPVQYNPPLGEVRVYESLRLRLTFNQLVPTQKAVRSASKGTSLNSVPAFDSFLRKSITNYQQAKSWRAIVLPTTGIISEGLFDPLTEYYKIEVENDGIYQITGEDLQNAGLDIRIINPSTIKVFNKGKEIPIKVVDKKDGHFDVEDAILFYGRFNRGETTYLSPYTRTNVYWLTWGGGRGLRVVEVDGGLYESNPTRFVQPNAFRTKKHFEQDWSFDRLLLVQEEQADHWFWQSMSAFQTYQFNFKLEQPDSLGNFAKVRIALQGSTHPSANPDHHVLAFLNGFSIGEALWDGQTEFIVENSRVPVEFLRNGENVLALEVPGDTQAGEVDQVFFNWLEVEYDQKFQAVDDYLEIQWQGTGLVQFTASGFSQPDIQIFDNHGRTITNYHLSHSDSNYSITFQDNPGLLPTTYFIFTPNAYIRAVSITRDKPSNLRSAQNGADYIIVTFKDFKEALWPLEQLRANQGLRVMTVDVQDIYDEFNHGVYDPRAIKAFLKYAYLNWIPPAPTYVLLVGDHHWGFDKEVARNWQTKSFVPTYMAYTVSWGLTSSDNYFVTISGDDPLPDMFIGRLPVNSSEEAEIIVNKILKYETQPNFGEWRRNVALSVGNHTFFEQQAEVLQAEFIPKDFVVPRLYTNPQSPYFGSTEELVEIFNEGASILNFIGHGGGGVFFDAELFLLEDIVLLDNIDRLPVAFSWSCFIGYFDNPWSSSLGEELLRVPEKGVVAHFGSAGRAWLFGDFFFNQALFNSLFRRHHRILGQVMTEAKIELLSNFIGYKDMVDNYVLLGDPAMKIGFPEKDIFLEIKNPAVGEGDTLRISGRLSEPLNGTVKLSFFDERDSLFNTNEAVVNQGKFHVHEIIKNFTFGVNKVKAYFWNETTDGSGVGFFTVARLHFSEGRMIPSNPAHLDTVHFFTRLTRNSLTDSLKVEKVSCQWSIDRTTWDTLSMAPYKDGYKSIESVTIFEGNTIFYQFLAKVKEASRSEVATIKSRLFSKYIPQRPDLTIPRESVSVGGTDEVVLFMQVENRGEKDAVQVPITLFEFSETPPIKSLVIREILPRVRSKGDTVLAIPWPSENFGSKQIEIFIDKENQIDEFNEFNNSVHLSFRLLTKSHGTGGPAFSPDSVFVVTVPENSINKNTSFSLRVSSNESFDFSESGLAPVSLTGGSRAVYNFALADTQVVFEKRFKIAFKLFRGDSTLTEFLRDSEISIYYYKSELNSWMPISTFVDLENSEVYSNEAFTAGNYGLFRIQDKDPPDITIKVNGQWFTDGDYVASNPDFSILISDTSGISLSGNSIRLILDKELIPNEQYSFGYLGSRPTTVLLNYSPNLSSGPHLFTILAEDIHGNFTESSIRFEVSHEFQLLSLANHPNPFMDNTIIAYTLTNEAEATEIKIYTVAGHLIRSFEFFNEVGYVEHVWDGTDDFGNDIANGVYYMRFVVKKGNERIEQIQKLAKLR